MKTTLIWRHPLKGKYNGHDSFPDIEVTVEGDRCKVDDLIPVVREVVETRVNSDKKDRPGYDMNYYKEI